MNNPRSSSKLRSFQFALIILVSTGLLAVATQSQLIVKAVSPASFSTFINRTSASKAAFQAPNCADFGFRYGRGFAPEPSTQARPISVITGDFNKDGKQDLIAANLFSGSISVLIGDGAGGFSMPNNIPVITNFVGVPGSVAAGDFNGDGNLDVAIPVLYDPGRVIVMNGDGTGNFTFTNEYATGQNSTAITVADFNGDGKPDIAVANKGAGAAIPGNVSVLLNDGSGGFSAAVNFPAGTNPSALVSGDYTGDGKNDLAVANRGSANVSILVNNGSGGFAAPVNFTTGNASSGIAQGFLNNDTRLDLAVSNQTDGTVSILLADNAGGFNAATNFNSGPAPVGIAINDFDGNSKQDLAITNANANQTSVLLNNGSGGFGLPSVLSVGAEPISLVSGDFNGDAKGDLAVANNGSNNISILLGIGNGTFGGTTFLLNNPQSVAVMDFNNDGRLDLAVANFSADKVTIFLSDGTGGYLIPNEFLVHIKPSSIMSGDFNKDGKPDLAVANNGSADVTILLGDGNGNFTSAGDFAAATQPRSLAVADINKDGNLDLVTANEGSSNISLLLGNGDGTFAAPQTLAAGTVPVGVIIRDFNNDNNLDIAVANRGSSFISILLGNGAGAFAAAANVNLGAGLTGRHLTAGDFNKDGKLDLAISINNSSSLAILTGNGSGGFTVAPTLLTAGSDPRGLTAADLDGDTILDLTVVNGGDRNLSIFRGKADGTFEAQRVFDTGYAPIDIAAADLNNDQRTDLAVINSGSNSMSLLLNTCANTPPSIIPAAALIRLQGSPATTGTLAVVSDAETAAGNLIIAATSLPAGLNITNLANTNGTITAMIASDCAATVGDKIIALEVTDAKGLKTSANALVTVTANTPPALGNYSNIEIVQNASTTVIPSTVPVDNGSVATVTVAAPAGLTGTAAVNAASGIVTLTNISSVGLFTLTVTATDNCSATASKNFTLNVVPPVVITSLDPASKQALSGDFSLTVNGSGFTANSKVRWNGTDRPTTYVSPTKLTAAVNAADINSQGTANVTVFDPAAGGLTSLAAVFTITPPNPVPVITALAPNNTLAGGTAFILTVNGSNFISGSVVKFNGIDRTTTFISGTQLTIPITATDLASAGSASVTVFNPAPGGGTSGTANLAINNPAPGAITLNPAAVLAGAANTTVLINGSNFRPDSIVRINGADRTTTVISPAQLSVQLLSSELTTAGMLSVAVFTPLPGGGLSPATNFTVNNPAPAITLLTPASVFAGDGGFTLALSGSNFINGSIVRFNGVDRTTTYISSSRLSIAIPATDITNAGSAALTVFNPAPGGGTSGTANLEINNPAPILTSLDKISALLNSLATPLVLTGNKFRPNSIVRVNGVDRTTTFTSATQLGITLTVADLATAGALKLSVFTPTPGGGSSAELSFTVGNPVPVLGSLTSTVALAGGAAFTQTLNGTGFTPASIVRVNGADRATTVISGSQVSVQVTAADIANSGSVKFVVFNPAPAGGTSNELSLAVNNPPPTTGTLSQTSIVAGSGQKILTIDGTGFRPNSVVRVNGQDRVTTFISGTQLSFVLLPSDLTTAGTLMITVFTPAPGGGLSPGVVLLVNNPPPSLISITPNSAFKGDPAFTMTVAGSSFVNGSIVRWNGSPRETNYISSSQLTVKILESDLAAAASVSVTVLNPEPGGGISAALIYKVNPLTGFEADLGLRPTGDGAVSITDWVLVGRMISGLDSPMNSSEFQRADCAPIATFGDGKLSVNDWVQAGRYAIGLDPIAAAAGPSRPVTAALRAETLASAARSEAAQPELIRVLRAQSATFKRGEVNALPLEFEAQGDENALSFTLNFDPKLVTYASFKAPEGWAINVNTKQAGEGRLGVMMALSVGKVAAAGKQQLLTLYFGALGVSGNANATVSFDDQIFDRDISDAKATLVPRATYESATINISGNGIANVRAASYVGPDVAGDSIASAFGIDLATTTAASTSLPLPTTLGGTSVKITDSQGIERLAPLFFVSPSQINYLVPDETADGLATVTITNNQGKASKGLLPITATAPSLFSADATGKGIAAAQAVRVYEGRQNYEAVAQYDAAQGKMIALPIDLGPDRGDHTEQVYLVLYGTGIRHRKEVDQIQLRIDNEVVPVEYAGAQGGYAGLDQINARIPRSLMGRGEVRIELLVDGKAANSVNIMIR